MADISQLEVNGTTYDICDATARDSLSQYLPLTGGTVIGAIEHEDAVVSIKNTGIDRDGIIPSADVWGMPFMHVDKDGEDLAHLAVVQRSNGNISCGLYTYNEKTDETQVRNHLAIIASRDGSVSYEVASPAAFRQAISGYWPLYPDINRGVAPSTTTYIEGIQWNDKRTPTKRLSFIRSIFQADGKNALQLAVFNSPDSTGATEKSNSLHLYVTPDGTCSYTVSDPAAFRAAIGFECFGRMNNLTANTTLTTTSAQMPLKNFMGKGCTASSNGIKMPYTGIYLIWGSIYIGTGAALNDIIHVQIRVDGTNIMENLYRCPGASPYQNFKVGPWIYGAEANQVAQLYAYNQAQASGVVTDTSSTNLMVIKIA